MSRGWFTRRGMPIDMGFGRPGLVVVTYRSSDPQDAHVKVFSP